MEYTKKKQHKDVINYFYKEGLDKYFDENILKNIEYEYNYIDPNFSVDPNNKIPFPIDLEDLVNIHKLIRKRKVFTILEYGIGYSTIIMADAIHKNKLDFSNQSEDIKNSIRCNNKFEIHSIDNDEFWVNELKKIIYKLDINDYIHLYLSKCNIGTFNDRICHFYEQHPSIVPDFIYIDGPSAYSVNGDKNGINFKSLDMTVMAGDLLIQEPMFIPGLFILIDGRTNNAYFLKNNFQRNYKYNYENDQHTFELIDKPLGKYNIAKLKYCNIPFSE